MLWAGVAPFGRTAHVIFTIAEAADSDVTSTECFLTKSTEALIVE